MPSVVNIGSNSGVAASIAVTVGSSGVPLGATILVCAGDNSTGTLGSVSDSGSNSYIKEIGQANGSNTGASIIFRAKVITTALVNGNTITYTLGSGATAAAVSAFYSQGLTSASVDVSAGNSGSSTTPTVSATPSQADDLFIGVVSDPTTIASFTQDTKTMLIDDNSISCFIDNLGVTCWIDDVGQSLCCYNVSWASPPGQVTLTGPTLVGGSIVSFNTNVVTYAPTLGTSVPWSTVIAGFKAVPTDFTSRAMFC